MDFRVLISAILLVIFIIALIYFKKVNKYIL